jgi:hypothetical protein
MGPPHGGEEGERDNPLFADPDAGDAEEMEDSASVGKARGYQPLDEVGWSSPQTTRTSRRSLS